MKNEVEKRTRKRKSKSKNKIRKTDPPAWRQDLKNQAKRWEGWRFSKNAHFRAVDQQVEKKCPQKALKTTPKWDTMRLKTDPENTSKKWSQKSWKWPSKTCPKSWVYFRVGRLGALLGHLGRRSLIFNSKNVAEELQNWPHVCPKRSKTTSELHLDRQKDSKNDRNSNKKNYTNNRNKTNKKPRPGGLREALEINYLSREP